jgi:hypothetical protein
MARNSTVWVISVETGVRGRREKSSLNSDSSFAQPCSDHLRLRAAEGLESDILECKVTMHINVKPEM